MARPECFHQSQLNDLFSDLDLSKELAELLVLKSGTNVSVYRHRDKEFRRYFQEVGVFVTCIDIR